MQIDNGDRDHSLLAASFAFDYLIFSLQSGSWIEIQYWKNVV